MWEVGASQWLMALLSTLGAGSIGLSPLQMLASEGSKYRLGRPPFSTPPGGLSLAQLCQSPAKATGIPVQITDVLSTEGGMPLTAAKATLFRHLVPSST